MSDLPQKLVPRSRGGKREGTGRPPKNPQDSLHQVNVYVDYDTLIFLKALPRGEAVELKRQAVRVLKMAEIESRIL
jgi:hypothetical protein